MHEWLRCIAYDWMYVAAKTVFTFLLSYRGTGKDNIPSEGPVLVLANHQSVLDPVLVGVSLRRRIFYLARKSLYSNFVARWFFHFVKNIPIDRDVGKEGLQKIIELLQAGEAVLVFPEGTRTKNGKMNVFRPGVHLLISRARPVILPIGIAGAFAAWPPGQRLPKTAPIFFTKKRFAVAVCVGEPFDSGQYADLPRAQVVADLHKRVAEMVLRAEELCRTE